MQQPGSAWPRFEERFGRTLLRTVAIALVVGAVFAVQQRRLQLLLPVALLVSWFSLGGHYVEIAFLNGLRPHLPAARWIHIVVRFLVWFAGGIILYLGMAATALALPIRGPSMTLWWCGGLLLIGVEFVAHAVMAMRGVDNFYNGRG
jgi:hypothetical protein